MATSGDVISTGKKVGIKICDVHRRCPKLTVQGTGTIVVQNVKIISKYGDRVEGRLVMDERGRKVFRTEKGTTIPVVFPEEGDPYVYVFDMDF